MDLRQLRTFLVVANTRSFCEAAQNLFISRQAVSKTISQLEDELDVKLFMRGYNGAFLTPAGIVFYDRIRSLVMEIDSVQEEMKLYGTHYHQRVRLAFSIGTIALYEPALLEFREFQKNVQIEYNEYPEERCYSLLSENCADIVICTTPIKDSLVVTDEIYRSRYGVLLRDSDRLDDLKSCDLQELSWIPLAGIAGQPNFENELSFTGYDYHRLFTLVQDGKCALLLPKCLAPRENKLLRWIPINQELYWIVYRAYLQSLDKNILYRTVLDELQFRVLTQSKMENEI